MYTVSNQSFNFSFITALCPLGTITTGTSLPFNLVIPYILLAREIKKKIDIGRKTNLAAVVVVNQCLFIGKTIKKDKKVGTGQFVIDFSLSFFSLFVVGYLSFYLTDKISLFSFFIFFPFSLLLSSSISSSSSNSQSLFVIFILDLRLFLLSFSLLAATTDNLFALL